MEISTTIAIVVAACCVIGLSGCKKEATTPSPAPAASTGSGDDHGHEHGEEGHDHSVAGHAHGSGPHGGTLADWGGGKYHVEFTVDHDKTEATVYVLGGDEKTPTPIAAEEIELTIIDPAMQVMLKATPQEGDPEGQSTRFVGTHEKLGVVQEYAGTITGVIEGTPYTGEFEEE